MNIIQIVPSILEESSGPSYSVKRLCEKISEKKHLELLTLSNKTFLRNKNIINQNLNFHKEFDVNYLPRRLGSSSSMKKYIKNKVSKNDIDIIHNHGMWQMSATYSILAKKFENIKIINSPRGTLSSVALSHSKIKKNAFWFLFQKKSLKISSAFHATSEQEFRDIRDLGFKQPIIILPNGIDIPRPRKEVITKKRKILFLGRINKKKGIENLLYAWKVLMNDFIDWDLEIVGSDEQYGKKSNYLSELKQIAIKLKLKNIRFCEPIYGEEKFLKYIQSDIMVLPSYSENFANTVSESLASGTPVITTKATPWKKISDYKCGWYIDTGYEPLLNCLNKAMKISPESLSLMGHNGRDWMRKEYSWDGISEKMILSYEWLHGSGKQHEWIITN